MKHQLKRIKRRIFYHGPQFTLGWTRQSSKGWDWRCDGDTDPLRYWRRWASLEVNLGFHTIYWGTDERWDETSYHEFHPAFPPGDNTPPPSCACDKTPIATGEYCNLCWNRHNYEQRQKAKS